MQARGNEAEIKMPAHLRQTCWEKPSLFGRVLSDFGYQDKRIVEDIASRFKLSGWMPASELFPRQFRRSELQQSLEDIIQRGDITPKEADRARGRMIFFECVSFGGIANLDLELFGDLCRAGRTTSTLSVGEIQVIQHSCQRVQTGTAMSMESKILETRLIFTDGAREGDVSPGSIGGVWLPLITGWYITSGA